MYVIPKIKDHMVEVFSIFHFFKLNYGILKLKNVLPIQMSILPFIVVFIVYPSPSLHMFDVKVMSKVKPD